jgi:hypothetical protein
MLNKRFAGCFSSSEGHFRDVSLNRCEQIVFDYVRTLPEERQYLRDKVRAFVSESPDVSSAVARIDYELWRYFEERSGVVASFNEALGSGGPRRTSMKNLAELWARLWTEPRPAKPAFPVDPNSRP